MDALQEVLGLELLLLNPAVRAVPEQVLELLHADFVEYGASGRVCDRASMVAALAAALGDGIVQVRYRLASDRPSLRTSIWLWDGVSWRLWFHRGAPTYAV